MSYRLVLFGFLFFLLANCQRPVALFQPTSHPGYKTTPLPDEALISVSVDSIRSQTAIEAIPIVSAVSLSAPDPAAKQTSRQIRQRHQSVQWKSFAPGVVASKTVRAKVEPTARRAATHSLVAALVGIAGLVAAALVPGASILFLLIPIGGIWAIVSAVRAIRRSQKGDRERGKATIGLILGILLSLVSLLFIFYVLAFAGAF